MTSRTVLLHIRPALAVLALAVLAPAALAAGPETTLPQPKPKLDRTDLSATIADDDAPIPRPAPTDRPQRTASLVPQSVDPNAPAKQVFGRQQTPAPLKPRAIGFYSKGCLAGARPLPVTGRTWQVMRLSRNRNWGHPELIDYLEDLAGDAPKLGWNGLLIGDLAQPRGGPMLTGHASHQIGLDADIWLTPMPGRTLSAQEREKMAATSMLGPRMARIEIPEGGRVDRSIWTDAHARLIKRAAGDRRVARIFVHPGIKKKLCDWATGDRSWLRKVRPWYGHHYHFHVRLSCPRGSSGCKDQSAPPAGDGCGKPLSWWLSDAPYAKRRARIAAAKKGAKTWKPMAVRQLPAACSQVLVAR
ncbi:penicillin-insensitive murein endopeptidase [Rhodobium orientis]|uniref:Penicillin-insensitive murein endopeptidase n=1 Tax=Rhodobium orientis TaxID=34017 RepID=A0A327JHL8_9HYPH|nr:penicillin-insensitive murein endopeptidase [Rhodobium orientis]MBB4302091.1 penicillin-insensitive murein endopeptidase [Rhodobium orientis]MBK5951319.1 penicillin-insensitive murein endopeptidase [Rhodobium orientis]RAI25887.1 penicillin-insensitive murein endopeptidase [Rhodobium orientis]